jgi:hypothetical protein
VDVTNYEPEDCGPVEINNGIGEVDGGRMPIVNNNTRVNLTQAFTEDYTP